jgi:hypothetical protein
MVRNDVYDAFDDIESILSVIELYDEMVPDELATINPITSSSLYKKSRSIYL